MARLLHFDHFYFRAQVAPLVNHVKGAIHESFKTKEAAELAYNTAVENDEVQLLVCHYIFSLLLY